MDERRLWMDPSGTLYRLRIDYGEPLAATLHFLRVCDGWRRSVPIHRSASLDRMGGEEIAELLREAMDGP